MVKWYPNDYAYQPLQTGPLTEGRVWVVESDCLEAGLALKHAGYNPAVLIMASPARPGGGYKNGRAVHVLSFAEAYVFRCWCAGRKPMSTHNAVAEPGGP